MLSLSKHLSLPHGIPVPDTVPGNPRVPSTAFAAQGVLPLDPENIPIVARRNYVLDLLASDPTRRVLTGDTYSAEEFQAAKTEPILLAPQQRAQRWQAPHFVWAVRKELAGRLCGEAETCPVLERGGLVRSHKHGRVRTYELVPEPFAARAHLVLFLHDEVVIHTPAALAEAVADEVRAAAAEAGQLLFGDFPVKFPLSVAVAECYAHAK
jgi:hypothetical protein